MLFTVRVLRLGKYCVRGLEYAALALAQDRGHIFFPIWTDLGRKKTKLRSYNKSVRVRGQDAKSWNARTSNFIGLCYRALFSIYKTKTKSKEKKK